MPRRVLVTGATGFVGGAVCRALARSGRTVHAIVRDGGRPADATLPVAAWHRYTGTDRSMRAILREACPEAVVHMAAATPDHQRPGTVDTLVAGNVQVGAQLLEAACAVGCRTVINTGTYWEHLDGSQAVSLYAALKQAFSRVLQYYCDAHAMRAITLTLYDTYGPHDPRGKFISQLVDAAIREAPLPASDGLQRIELVHIDDVAAAYDVALTRVEGLSPGRHDVFAVRTGRAFSLREIADVTMGTLGRPVEIRWGARQRHPRTFDTPPDLPVLPGWAPKIALAEGVAELATKRANG